MELVLARAGLADNGKSLTPEIIREVVETFSEIKSAPVTIGHELADYMPAYGWVKSLRANEDNTLLFGEVELLPPLRDAYELGYFRKWSIGVRKRPKDGKRYLHHLAFLGAVPPAIKGLEVIKMAEEGGEMEEFEFADKVRFVSKAKTSWDIADKGTSWDADGAKRRLVKKGGWKLLSQCCGAVEFHDDETELPSAVSRYHFPFCDVIDGKVKIVPKAVSSAIGYLHGARGVKVREDLARVVRPVFDRLKKRIDKYFEKEADMADIEILKKENAELKARIEELEEKLKEAEGKAEEFSDLKRELERLKTEFADAKARLRKEKISRLKEIAQGKVPKESLDKLLAFAEKLPDEELEFAEGDKKVKRDPIEVLSEIFASLPKPVSEGILAMGDVKTEEEFDPNQIAQKL